MNMPPQFAASPGRRRRRKRIVTAIARLLIAGAVASAAPPQSKRRGRFLRTKVVKTEHTPSFSCTLAPSEPSIIHLQVEKVDLVTIHEVKLYETVVERRTDEGSAAPGRIDYRVIPGELTEGERITRSHSVIQGPLANEALTIDGHAVVTDANGIITDRDQYLLALFDDFAIRTTTITVQHAKMGAITLCLSREILRRRPLDEAIEQANLAQTDILAAMGLNFTQLKRSSAKGLRHELRLVGPVRPGQRFQVVLHMNNQGDLPVCGLIARTFSRHAWLDGKNFYFGNIPPGGSRSFRRWFTVPRELDLDKLYAGVGLWNILGVVGERPLPLVVTLPAAPKKDMPGKKVKKKPAEASRKGEKNNE